MCGGDAACMSNYFDHLYAYVIRMPCSLKTSRALNNKKIKSNSVTQLGQTSNELLKSDVFSCWLKTDSDGDTVTCAQLVLDVQGGSTVFK